MNIFVQSSSFTYDKTEAQEEWFGITSHSQVCYRPRPESFFSNFNETIIFVFQANTTGKAVVIQCQQRPSRESDLHLCKVVMRFPNTRRGDGNVRESQGESLDFHPWELIMRPPSPLVSGDYIKSLGFHFAVTRCPILSLPLGWYQRSPSPVIRAFIVAHL